MIDLRLIHLVYTHTHTHTHERGAQIPGHTSLKQIYFVEWYLVFVGP